MPVISLFITIIWFFSERIRFLSRFFNYKRPKSDHLIGFLTYLRKKQLIEGEKVIIKDDFILIMETTLLIIISG